MSRLKLTDSDLPDLLGSLRRVGRHNFEGKCPFCLKEKHFFIKGSTTELDKRGDNKSFNWECKKCGENGKIYKLLRHLGRLDEFVEKTVDILNLVKLNNFSSDNKFIEKELPNVLLPVGWERIYNNRYLEQNRKFQRSNFYKYKIGITDLVSKYENYVIFAVEEQGQTKGFVGRCTLSSEEIVVRNLNRYENSKTEFSWMLFGYDELTENTKIVILVEGLFDKIRLDNILKNDDSDEIKVLCTWGNKISEQQIRKILKFDIERIILFYDIDAVKQIKKYAEELQNCFENVEIAYLSDGKDPGDADEQNIFFSLQNTEKPAIFKSTKVSLLKIK